MIISLQEKNVYFTNKIEENYKNKRIKVQFIELLVSNIDEVLASMKLNEYIENIQNGGEFAGIIELSIADKKISTNLFVYKEDNLNSNKYILYEKIDTYEI